MRTKNLRLNRETLTRMNPAQLRRAAGGYSVNCGPTVFLCPTDILSVCRCLDTIAGCGDGGGGGGGESDGCPDSAMLCITR